MVGVHGFPDLRRALRRILVDALLTHCPSTAAKLWTKMPLWMKAIHSAKGSAMMDGVLYQVLHAIEGLPKVLEGKELEEFCKKNIEIANLGKGTTMDAQMALECSWELQSWPPRTLW